MENKTISTRNHPYDYKSQASDVAFQSSISDRWDVRLFIPYLQLPTCVPVYPTFPATLVVEVIVIEDKKSPWKATRISDISFKLTFVTLLKTSFCTRPHAAPFEWWKGTWI